MEKLYLTVVYLLLPTFIHSLARDNCVSKDGSKETDNRCQNYCARGQCPSFCLCVSNTSNATCANLGLTSKNRKEINETVRPGTPIITIQVIGQEKWSYTLQRGGSVDGSVWSSLSTYLKLTKIGNRYELIVDVTPDLEAIYQQYGIQLTELTLVLTCKRNGLPDKVNNVILQILPVNEYAPEFVTPLRTTVPENTKVGTVIYLLRDHTIDLDVNPARNEISGFGIWEYLHDVKRDGRAYFQMTDKFNGSIQVKKELDFDALQTLDATLFFLKVSASDVHGLMAYATLTIAVEDVDDLPPQFYHHGCLLIVEKSKPCITSYEAAVPLHFQGQITNIFPGFIQARDMDSLNTSVQYSLKQGHTKQLDNVKQFAINKTTGRLFVLSPFLKPSEIHLIIVATEVSKNARYTEASLRILVADSSLKVHGSSLDSGTNTSVSNESTVDMMTISTVILSISVTILLVVSIALCVKLNTLRTPSVLPVEFVPTSDAAAPSHNNTDYQSVSSAPSGSTLVSTVGVNNKEGPGDEASINSFQMETQSTYTDLDHDQHNAANNLASVIHFMPSVIYKNGIRNFGQHKNVKISTSALSSVEVERRITLALLDRQKKGNSGYGKVAISEYRDTGRDRVWREKLFLVPDRAYQGADNQLPSNVVSLSDPTQTPKYYQREISADSYQNLLSRSSRDNVNVYQLSTTEAELTGFDKNSVFKQTSACPRMKKVKSVSSNTTKSRRSDEKIGSCTQSRSKQVPHLYKQKVDYLRDSSDYCSAEESDDGYRNESNISDVSSGSYSGTKSKTSTRPHGNIITPLPLERSTASQNEGELKRSSGSFTQREARKSQLLPLMNVPGEVEQAKCDYIFTEKCNNVPLRTEENKGQSPSVIRSHKIQTTNEEQSTKKITTNSTSKSSSFALETQGINQMQTFAENRNEFNETGKELETPDLGRSSAFSSSNKTSKVKGIGKKEMSTNQTSEKVFGTCSSHSRKTTAIKKIRPHTSDDIQHMNKTVKAAVVGRSSTSAPSLTRRRNKKKTKIHQVNINKGEYADEFVPEGHTVIFPTSCGDSQEYIAADYDPLELHMQEQLMHLHPWPSGQYLVTDKFSPHHVEIHEHEYQVPVDSRQHWQSGGGKVYIKKFLHRPYLRHHLQQVDFNYMMQQHRLYSVPEVPDRYIHHQYSPCLLESSKGEPEIADEDENKSKCKDKPNKINQEEEKQDGQPDSSQ